MGDDDWKTIRAARWRAEQGKQQNSSTASRSTTEAPVAAAPQTKACTPVQFTALRSSRASKVSVKPPAGLHAAVAGLILMLVGMAVHKKVQLLCENFGLNQGDMPDARMRPAYSHRDYIINKRKHAVVAFVKQACQQNSRSWPSSVQNSCCGMTWQ